MLEKVMMLLNLVAEALVEQAAEVKEMEILAAVALGRGRGSVAL